MRRSENFMLQHVGGVALLTPLGAQVMDMNGLVILNDTACCVWELLAEERTLDELAAAVAARFTVTPARARADVHTFLDEIAPLGMVIG
jgi:hypothetical protein